MVNEFAAKKLGEVLAFCRVGILLAERSGKAMSEALGVGEDINFSEELKSQASKLEEIASGEGVQNITFPKTEKTGAKLTSMMELYVGDEWDNPSEIMEWTGFFEGSAIVHWQLVAGMASALGRADLAELSARATEFHQNMLDNVSGSLRKIGTDKAK